MHYEVCKSLIDVYVKPYLLQWDFFFRLIVEKLELTIFFGLSLNPTILICIHFKVLRLTEEFENLAGRILTFDCVDCLASSENSLVLLCVFCLFKRYHFILIVSIVPLLFLSLLIPLPFLSNFFRLILSRGTIPRRFCYLIYVSFHMDSNNLNYNCKLTQIIHRGFL